MDEAALADQVAATGNVEAFAALVRLYQGRVRAFLRRLAGGDHTLADDLAQDTFLEAYRKRAQYRGDGSFLSWLLRIAWTRFLMDRRSLRPPPEVLSEDLAAPNVPVDQRLDLERAMARLSAAERAALTLSYAFGFHHEEVAGLLGLPLGTVKSHVSRGREKLRVMLGNEP